MSLVCNVIKIRETPYLYLYFYYFLFLCYISYIEFWYIDQKKSASFHATFLSYMKLHKLHGREGMGFQLPGGVKIRNL